MSDSIKAFADEQITPEEALAFGQASAGDVIAWDKDKYKLFKKDSVKSYVWECAAAVVSALKNCLNRENFIRRMDDQGWEVHWQDNRKHITFENGSGRKVRDSNLAKTFHLNVGGTGR